MAVTPPSVWAAPPITIRGVVAVTNDKDAKYKVLGENATLKREEHLTQGPTTSLLQQREQQHGQRPLYASPHRGPKPPATPDGPQLLPGGVVHRTVYPKVQ